MPLPSDKIVVYKIRKQPSDPSSDVLIEHRMHITARSQSGDDITWRFTKLVFDETGGGTWANTSPGLSDWVVTHDDPDTPVASDFTDPPTMSGTAAVVPAGPGTALTYSLANGSCSASEGQMYGGDVICAVYNYAAAATIAEEEDDEPAETEVLEDP